MADNKFLDQSGLSTLWSQIGNIYARVRRDNHYNYHNDFVPINREICFVDGQGGLRAKVGDGITQWKDLPYTDETLYQAIDNLIQRGYYYEDKFYSDSLHTKELTPSLETIYIEVSRSDIYLYNGSKYIAMKDNLPAATAQVPGIMKLYTEKGQNTDGTMTQKAITDDLNTKVSASVDQPSELLIFSIN